MATEPGVSTIQAARPYWLEQVPYTATLAGLSAGSRQPLFPTLTGWQSSEQPDMYVELTSLGISQIPGLQLQVANDRDTITYDAGEFPPDLELVPIRRGAIHTLSVQLVNSTSATIPYVQVLYLMTFWRMPTAFKVLRGYPISPAERQAALDVGLTTDPNQQSGVYPHSLDTIMADTYANRIIGHTLEYSNLYQATTTQANFWSVQVSSPNELLVLRAVAARSDPDDGVSLLVDRDDNLGHLNVQTGLSTLQHGFPAFVVARRRLNFYLVAQQQPAAPTPVRIEVWRLSASNILRERMGLLTPQQLAQQMAMGRRLSQEEYQRLYQQAVRAVERVEVGIN
jgi:hypothetical protein